MKDNGVVVDELVSKIHKRYEQKVGNLNFPIDENKLITVVEEMKGIKIELEEMKKENPAELREGILIPTAGGFLIKYVKNNSLFRRRFTISHELAHILFYDCSNCVPKLPKKPEEYVCDEIARKLLLPKRTLELEFQKYRLTAGNLIPFLREVAKAARVSMYPLVKSVVEDFSLLDKTMVTFWFLKKRCEDYSQIQNPKPILARADSKLSKDLRRILTPYWRSKIREYVWNNVIQLIINDIDKTPLFLSPQNPIKSGRKRKGGVESISFSVECDFYNPQQTLFKWDQLLSPQFISVEKVEVKIWP
jgi:Zn-dependent peptidase ImmA (M78 family)